MKTDSYSIEVKCRPLTIVSGNVMLDGYSQGFLREGVPNDIGVIDDGNFLLFSLATSSTTLKR